MRKQKVYIFQIATFLKTGVYIYICMYVCMYIYIYIYLENKIYWKNRLNCCPFKGQCFFSYVHDHGLIFLPTLNVLACRTDVTIMHFQANGGKHGVGIMREGTGEERKNSCSPAPPLMHDLHFALASHFLRACIRSPEIAKRSRWFYRLLYLNHNLCLSFSFHSQKGT